jgi:hypothetical protein
MKLACLMLSTFVAVSALAQTSSTPPKPAEAANQPQTPPPTKRLFIADYIISGAVGSAHTDTSGNTYGSAVAVGRNISLEATDGFMKNCPAVTVTNDRDAAVYILRPNKGSSTLYKKDGDVAYVSHAKVEGKGF